MSVALNLVVKIHHQLVITKKKKLNEVINYSRYFSKVDELRLTVIIVLLVTFLHFQAGK